MTNLIISRILESIILSLVVLILCSVLVPKGLAGYFILGLVIAGVQCVQKFSAFKSENRWILYSIVLVWDVIFWPGAVVTSINKAYRGIA